MADLDLSDHEVAARILATDKHQLVEGLVVECLFDQIVSCVPSAAGNFVALDVETIAVHARGRPEPWIAFIWPRTKSVGLGRYLHAVGRTFATYLLTLKDGTFLAARYKEGKRDTAWLPLSDLLSGLSGRPPQRFNVDESVRDTKRQRQAFWGFLSDYYKSDLGSRVVLPRLLINCAIQPYFRAVWNLDRIFVSDDDIWLFEIKHKYPINGARLAFGLNDGELLVLDRFAKAGVRCFHTILVKPFWDKHVGSMYLLNDLAMRARAGVIATVLDAGRTSTLLKSGSGRSASHTSINGESTIAFKSIPANSFRYLGVLSDPPKELAFQMVSAMLGEEVPVLKDDWLRYLKTADTPRS